MNLNEMISKSLDEIDAMTEEFSKSKVEGTLSKAQDDEDLNAGDVSEDAPQEDNEDAPEEGAPQEDAPEEGAPQEDNEDVDNDEEGEQDSGEDEDVEKSLADSLKSNDSVRKALEVSEFLDTLVKSISDSISNHSSTINNHNESLAKSLQAQEQSNELLAKSLMGMVKSQKAILEQNSELQKSVRVLNKRLKAIEEQPLVRKSVASAQPINKSFEASAGNKPKATNALSKSQISAKLMSAYEGGNTALMTDVLAFDSTGKVETLSNEAKTILGL
jgi:hypothetical protein